MSTNTANTTSPQSNRISDMNDPLDDLCNQFSDQLDDLIMSTLRNQLPARCVADALVRAIAAISIGARINTADLMSDLADIVAETDIEYDDQQGYLH